jgi:hypothetical protein
MEFRKYMHIEKFGTDEVEGIEFGKVYVFPKIDGSNGSVWLHDNGKVLCAGSRNRELSLEKDNAGFLEYVRRNANLRDFFMMSPYHRLFGEWMVPHSLKTYRDDAWRRFFVFDVTEETDEAYRYLPYDEYKPLMEAYGIDYIPPISIIDSPSTDQLMWQLKQNVFLIEDGKGVGEGIVLKNYNFVNKYGRVTWAKIVTSEFKEKHSRTMGPPEMKGERVVERDIAEKYVTKALCEKVYVKILNEDGWRSEYIPRLLNTIYYDLIREESWNFIKEFKRPTIDYKKLFNLTVQQVKIHLPNLF